MEHTRRLVTQTHHGTWRNLIIAVLLVVPYVSTVEIRDAFAHSPKDAPVAEASNGTGSIPANLVVMGNIAFFSANDGEHGRELWLSNSTTSGTQLVRDIQLPVYDYHAYIPQ